MRATIASIADEQGPAKLNEVDAASATALAAIILAIFMASPLHVSLKESTQE